VDGWEGGRVDVKAVLQQPKIEILVGGLLVTRDEIHQTLLSHFYLPMEYFIGKLSIKYKDIGVLMLANLAYLVKYRFKQSSSTFSIYKEND
jgi:hypothetical protein